MWGTTETGHVMPKKIAGKTCYTLAEIADLLEVSEKTVTRYIKAGRLRAQRVGGSWLITRENLQRFLDGEN